MRAYLLALLLVAAAFLARLALDPLLGERSPFLFFTLAVLVAGARLGVGAGLAATALSTVAGMWAFMAPRWAMGPLTSDEWTNIAAFVATSLAMLLFAHQLVRSRASEAESAAAKRTSEDREQKLIDAVQDYAIFQIDPEGRVLTWNTGAERMKGWRAEEIVGKSYDIVHTPEQRAAGAPQQELRIAAETGRYEEEGERLRKDGSRFLAHVHLSPVRDDAGALTGFVKVTRDVTERKRAETEVRRLNETLEAQVKERTRELSEVVDELDAFTYTVSHDLRAPLRAMEGFGRILVEEHGQELDAEGRHYADRIVGAAERMEKLIDDLLAYSRLTRAEVELVRIEPDRLIERCVDDTRNSSPGGAAVRIALPSELPPVMAEPTVLHQVLCNLLSNAVKFHVPGEAADVQVRVERRNGRVRIWVEDRGIGIEPAHRDRIFRIFERLHGQESYPGTGVGLAIVRKGMERMGGSCGVESDPGKGSRFWIELEAAKEA
jgi:PAS domain S-box-containing protein